MSTAPKTARQASLQQQFLNILQVEGEYMTADQMSAMFRNAMSLYLATSGEDKTCTECGALLSDHAVTYLCPERVPADVPSSKLGIPLTQDELDSVKVWNKEAGIEPEEPSLTEQWAAYDAEMLKPCPNCGHHSGSCVCDPHWHSHILKPGGERPYRMAP